AITTRSGVSYDRPQILPLPSFLPKVVENEPEAIKDTMHPTNNRSTEDVQPPVVQSKSPILTSEPVNSPISEPVASLVSVSRPNQRPSISYPSRMQDQKLRDKANDQRKKFFQIFKDLNFNISFVDALILMLKFGPSIKILLTNKDKLYELARTPLNEHCSVVLLKKFPKKNKLSLPDFTPTCMTLELGDRSISHPVEVAEDVYVKVGTFHFSADFVFVDFDADPRVPLILGRSFLKTGRALIDVFEGKLTLRVGKEAITFNLDQTSRYSANYNEMMVKRIDVIDMACEEYSQEVMGFFDVITSEVDAFLALEDDPTSPKVDQSYLDSEGDILLLEAFLNDDPSLPPQNQGNFLPEVRKKLKICEAKSDKSSIDEPPEVELKNLPPHLEYAFLEEGIVLGHKISKQGIEVDKAKVDITTKLPHPTTVKGIRSFLGHAGFYRRKLTEAPILISPDWDMPFELMCDASDFAIGAILGQRQDKHFRPIHYTSKTMIEAESNYTTTEKEMLAVVYALEKFRSYLIMNKSIVYTDHSALKYLFAKKDSKARLLRWVLLLHEFTFKVIDTKGVENLAVDHLS
nr:reverse transcriptase domain-containing protein [Tanacetum cinerariifolium]